jgi:uncharacterized protein DUF3309
MFAQRVRLAPILSPFAGEGYGVRGNYHITSFKVSAWNFCLPETFLVETFTSEATMLTTILIVILILALVGALPHWGYSRNWGYGPGGGLGLILIIVLILVLTGRV